MKLTTKIGVVQMTDDHFRAVIVKTGSVPPKVLEWTEASFPPLGDDASLNHLERVKVIQNALAGLKQSPILWVYNAPQSASVMRQLSVPFKGASKVCAALTFELEPYLAIPIESLIIDYIPIRELDGKSEVFVMGLKKDHAERQLSLLKDAGINVESIGLDIVGLAALEFETNKSKNAGSAAILRQEGSAYLTITHNKSLAYVQRIVADPEQASVWTQEVQNGIRAFQANSLQAVEINALTCCDPRMDADQLATIEDQLEMPVTQSSLGDDWAPDELLQDEHASIWLSMIGAATAGAGGSFNISFTREDLEDLAPPMPYRKHIAVVAMLLIVAIGAHLAVTSLRTTRHLAEIDVLGAQVHAVMAQTFPSHEVAKQRPAGDGGGAISFDAMQQALDDELQSGSALTPEMLNEPSFPNLLRELSAHMPGNLVDIEDITMMTTRRGSSLEIRIKGTTKGADAFGKVTTGLRSSKLLKIVDSERSSIGGKERFTIVAQVVAPNTDS